MPGFVGRELNRLSRNNDLLLIEAKHDLNSLDCRERDNCALSGSGKVSKKLLSQNCLSLSEG